MTVENQNIIVTNEGLTRVARELINNRIYDSTKINIYGNLVITSEGLTASLSSTSYPYYTFSAVSNPSVTKVAFEGVYSYSNKHQTCWTLVNTNTPNENLSLVIYNTKICIFYGSTQVFCVEDLNFKDKDSINIEVEMRTTTCLIKLIQNENYYTYEGSFSQTITLNNRKKILIGYNNKDVNSYWIGLLNLTGLIVYNNSSLVYSPSVSPSFTFSKIMISDSTTELSDNSSPILNHVYEFPISELNRTDNSILITATVDSNVYLNINQVGLYISDEKGTYLFCTSSGLAIQKTSELGYDLIFNINLNLQVVNTTALPKIIVNKDTSVHLNSFNNLKNINCYVTTNLERAVVNNSLLIGYTKALIFNQLLNEIRLNSFNTKSCFEYAFLNQYLSDSNKKVLDFYSFPQNYFSIYDVNNLSGFPDSTISCIEGVITGQNDNIDFSKPLGETLSLKLNLIDGANKLILMKKFNGVEEAYYLKLEFINLALVFTLILEEETIVLKKQYDEATFRSITKNPITLSIVCDNTTPNPFYYMYVNSEEVAKKEGITKSYLDSSSAILVNYQDITDTTDNYIERLICFEGALSHSDVHLVSTLLETNF